MKWSVDDQRGLRSGYGIRRCLAAFVMGKRVQPINTALIPNWKTLIRAWLKATGLMLAAKFTAHLPMGAEPADVQH